MSDSAPPTPRKAIIAGVEFLRTKNNNLLRRPIANVASTYAVLEAQEVTDTTNYFTGRQASQSRNASTSSRTVFH